jgi:hypothetical protein
LFTRQKTFNCHNIEDSRYYIEFSRQGVIAPICRIFAFVIFAILLFGLMLYENTSVSVTCNTKENLCIFSQKSLLFPENNFNIPLNTIRISNVYQKNCFLGNCTYAFALYTKSGKINLIEDSSNAYYLHKVSTILNDYILNPKLEDLSISDENMTSIYINPIFAFLIIVLLACSGMLLLLFVRSLKITQAEIEINPPLGVIQVSIKSFFSHTQTSINLSDIESVEVASSFLGSLVFDEHLLLKSKQNRLTQISPNYSYIQDLLSLKEAKNQLEHYIFNRNA